MTTMTKGVLFILLAVLMAIAALFFMSPCSPAFAIAGVVLGCGLGFAAGMRGVRQSEGSRRGQFVNRLIVSVVAILVYVVVVGAARFRRLPEAPGWALVVGQFLLGGAYLTFILALFTAGISMVFYSLGGTNSRR